MLAIGLVVDDAIVMLENIYRHVEDGMEPVKAALLGSREISFAIIAMTITLAAVYAPIGFMTGVTGRLFTEFAWTLAGAVIVSGFVALTLSPMMCSKLLKHQSITISFYRIIERFLNGITAGYRRPAQRRARCAAAGPAARSLRGGIELFSVHHHEERARPGRGPRQHLRGVPRSGRRHHRIHRRLCQEARGRSLLPVPEADRVFVVAGNPTVSQGRVILRLKPWGERDRTQQEIATLHRARKWLPCPASSPFPATRRRSVRARARKPINFVIQTSQPYEELQKMVDALLDKVRDYPGLVDVDTDLQAELAAARHCRRPGQGRGHRASRSTRSGARSRPCSAAARSRASSSDGEQYDVVVKIADIDRQNPDDMRRIYVRGRDNSMIPLSNLITIKETVAPKELNHFNQLRAATITAQLAPGYSLSDGLDFLETDRQGGAAGHRACRLCGPVARVQGSQRRACI